MGIGRWPRAHWARTPHLLGGVTLYWKQKSTTRLTAWRSAAAVAVTCALAFSASPALAAEDPAEAFAVAIETSLAAFDDGVTAEFSAEFDGVVSTAKVGAVGSGLSSGTPESVRLCWSGAASASSAAASDGKRVTIYFTLRSLTMAGQWSPRVRASVYRNVLALGGTGKSLVTAKVQPLSNRATSAYLENCAAFANIAVLLKDYVSKYDPVVTAVDGPSGSTVFTLTGPVSDKESGSVQVTVGFSGLVEEASFEDTQGPTVVKVTSFGDAVKVPGYVSSRIDTPMPRLANEYSVAARNLALMVSAVKINATSMATVDGERMSRAIIHTAMVEAGVVTDKQYTLRRVAQGYSLTRRISPSAKAAFGPVCSVVYAAGDTAKSRPC